MYAGDLRNARGRGDVAVTDWGSMLDDLDVAIEEARYKIREGRVRSPEKERVRISWCKCLAY